MFKAMARAAGKISEPKVPVATVVAAGASYVLGRISTKLRVRVEELPPPVSELKSSKKKLSMKLKDNKISYGWKKKSLPGEDVEVDTTTTVMTALGAAVVGAFLGGLTVWRFTH